MKEAKERKSYERPVVVFDKKLEVIAADCDPTGDGTYLGGPKQPVCKSEGVCLDVLYS